MRRIPLAVATLLLLAPAAPAGAQWFGPPGPGAGGWGGPARFAIVGFAPAPPRIGPGGGGFGPPRPLWWGPPPWWRREARWRRFRAWRRWAALAEARDRPRPYRRRGTWERPQAEHRTPMAAKIPPFHAVQRAPAPDRPAAAVAMVPVGSIPMARRPDRPPARLIPPTTLLRHLPHAGWAPALAPPVRRRPAVFRPTAEVARPASRPAALTADPAPAVGPAVAAPPVPAAASAIDVPVAPLD